jgi:hypothetical protein
MFFLRLLGSWSLIVAIVALVADLTRSLALGGGISFTTLGKQWFDLGRSSLDAVHAALERHAGPWAWDPIATSVLQTPTWVVFATLGLLLYIAGRRRERVNIFAN